MDAVIDVPPSVALAVSQVVKEKDKILLDGSAAMEALTDAQCSPNTIRWSFNNNTLSQAGGSLVKAGNKSWYIITADYAFGITLEEQTAAAVKKNGGTVRGTLRYPFPDTTDFSSFLEQAQASGANAGADAVNCIKQAHEFGLNQTMKIVPLLLFITDVHALGPEMTHG